MSHETIQCGDLEAVIGDNGMSGGHRSGYNGLWSLKHKQGSRSLFVPAYAGMNHEHIFDGATQGGREVFFEPRYAAMSLRKTGDHSVELHQPPTPTFHLESWSRFTLSPPHYIDFEYECMPTQHVFEYGSIGLFWASYINAPIDKSLYFRGALSGGSTSWMQFCTQRHNDESTVLHGKDTFQLKFADDYRDCLFKNYSPMYYHKPFYYGHFEDQVWILMFDRSAGIRFTHSPSGGGYNSQFETTNPAWDFQFIIPKYDVNQKFGFRARAVFRNRCSRVEISDEFKRWSEQLEG